MWVWPHSVVQGSRETCCQQSHLVQERRTAGGVWGRPRGGQEAVVCSAVHHRASLPTKTPRQAPRPRGYVHYVCTLTRTGCSLSALSDPSTNSTWALICKLCIGCMNTRTCRTQSVTRVLGNSRLLFSLGLHWSACGVLKSCKCTYMYETVCSVSRWKSSCSL